MRKIQNHIEIKANEIIKKSRAFLEISKGKVITNVESNILLEIKNNNMYMYAFDGSILLKTKVNIINNNHNNSNICVYAKKFFDIIKVLKDATLFINISENNILTIQAHIDKKKYYYSLYYKNEGIYNKPNYQTSLKGIETSEFNECINNYKIECDNFVGVNKKEFIQILKKSLLFIDKNNYSYNGLFIDVNNNKLDIMATNGSKLIYNTIDYNNNFDKKHFIISYDTIQTIIKLYDVNKIEDYEILLFNIIDDCIIINSDNIELISSLHKEVKTPNYKNIIPKTKNYIELNKEQIKELKKHIKTVKKATKENYKKDVLLHFSKDKLDIIGTTEHNNLCFTIDISNNYNYKLYAPIEYILNILENETLKVYINNDDNNTRLFTSDNTIYLIYNREMPEKITNIIKEDEIIKEHTTENTQEVKKVSRQVKRLNERKKLKQSKNNTFIEYTRVLNIKDINIISIILSINNLRISEQEKIDLFNRQYNIYKIA